MKSFQGGGVNPIPTPLLGYKNILRGVVRLIFDFTLLSPHPTNGLTQCRCKYWKVIVFLPKK